MDTKEKIEVMQAYLDGKNIESHVKHPYLVTDFSTTVFNISQDYTPTWDWGTYIYKIKKEPRRFWILEGKESVSLYYNKVTALKINEEFGGKLIEVVEV